MDVACPFVANTKLHETKSIRYTFLLTDWCGSNMDRKFGVGDGGKGKRREERGLILFMSLWFLLAARVDLR